MKKLFCTAIALIAIILPLAGCIHPHEPAPVPTDAPAAETAALPVSTDAPTDTPAETPASAEPTAAYTAEPSPAATPEATPEPTVRPTDEPSAAPSQAPTAAPTAYPTAGPTPAPSPTAASTATPTPTPKPTAAPTDPPAGTPDFSVFDNCCFVGNSTFEGLHAFHVIDNGTWFTRVGLNVNTVYTTPTEHGSVPIIDELDHGSYDGILLMFGQNECGWPNLPRFLEKYEQLLADVHARQPQAKLFITGIPPVSRQVSDTNPNGITNPHIDYCNNGLTEIAARTPGVYFITVPAELIGPDGALPAAASSDGIHLNMTYMRYWANHICRSAAAVLG